MPCNSCSLNNDHPEYRTRAEIGDAQAIHSLGCLHSTGYCDSYGHNVVPQNQAKALKLYQKAGKLGVAAAHCHLGNAYYFGRGVERNEKKANHYWELAAMEGHVAARYNLGCAEARAENMDRAMKHHMIAAGCGYYDSLEKIKQMFMNGCATKDLMYAMRDDYSKALRAYQANLVQIKSPQRDEAAAFDNGYKYY